MSSDNREIIRREQPTECPDTNRKSQILQRRTSRYRLMQGLPAIERLTCATCGESWVQDEQNGAWKWESQVRRIERQAEVRAAREAKKVLYGKDRRASRNSLRLSGTPA